MDSSRMSGKRTRRQFLGDAIRLGAGVAALTALGSQSLETVSAAGPRPEKVEVLLEDVVEATTADFARGQARGVEIAADSGHAALRGKRGAIFTSGPRALSFQATHLGLHWVVRDASPEAISVEVRTSPDGTTWLDWQHLSVEAVAELPAGIEVFAALADGRRGRYAQYRLSFGSDQVTTLDRMTITSLNSVDGPREPLATTQATTVLFTAPGGGTFTVITREGWGCDESLRFRRGTELWPEMYVPAKKVVLHHTATSNTYTDSGAAAEVRSIYTYHTRTLGWGDIGYNSLIDKFGRVYEGRHGRGEGAGREILSADVVAGHTLSHNYGSTGVAVLGNFNESTIPVDPSTELFKLIANVMAFECGRHNIAPKGASDFLRSDDTWHKTLNNISGHYESYNTDCPGTNLKAQLPALQDAVAGRFSAAPAPTLTSDPLPSANLVEPAQLSFKWTSPYQYCLEGWYKPSNSYDISYLQGYANGPYDTLGKVQAWTQSPDTSATFPGLAAGHYTMHVRSSTNGYEANLTFLVKKVTTSGKPPRGK